MHICLFEDDGVRHLEPLTLTRHAADLRLGMHTIAEMHRAVFRPERVSFHARRLHAGATQREHPGAAVNELAAGQPVLLVNARYVPQAGSLAEELAASVGGGASRLFRQGEDVVAVWLPAAPEGLLEADTLSRGLFEAVPEEEVHGARMLARLWDLVEDVEGRITADFEGLGRRGTEGAVVHPGAHIAGTDVVLARGAVLLPGAVINALDGPVWIGEGATVEENAVVRGPAYIGVRTVVKAAARVDGSAIGYWCKVGGEVHGSVLHSLSAKPHDGYLGNSYLGRWCNLGADTNNSNLRNDYGEVSMYDPVAGDFVPTGRQFLGLVMGDHSKSAINFMFNTGTVVGVCCNLFGSGFPARHVPSFSWGGAEGLVEYRLDKALRVAEAVMARRDTALSEADREMLARVFEATAGLRGAAFAQPR